MPTKDNKVLLALNIISVPQRKNDISIIETEGMAV